MASADNPDVASDNNLIFEIGANGYLFYFLRGYGGAKLRINFYYNRVKGSISQVRKEYK